MIVHRPVVLHQVNPLYVRISLSNLSIEINQHLDPNFATLTENNLTGESIQDSSYSGFGIGPSGALMPPLFTPSPLESFAYPGPAIVGQFVLKEEDDEEGKAESPVVKGSLGWLRGMLE